MDPDVAGPQPGSETGPQAPHDLLVVTSILSIPLAELAWRYSTSGGPGGQHANRSATRAEVRWDVSASPSLSPLQRSRLLARLGPVASATSGAERSQYRNRELALDQLRAKLAAALAVERPRRPTRPTQGSRERRLQAKRRQARLKADRRGLSADDN
ncbi:MAG: alternative ribosome rescue aminoacyl-tRNA hydrolase ArfB [Acidimicrobiales bacterium]